MKSAIFAALALLQLALPLALQATDHPADSSTAPVLELQPHDCIAVVGNGLADRMQHDGWLETLIQARFPQLELQWRDLGFMGDELGTQLRSDGFGTREQWLTRVQATVVLAFFGYNESFGGAAAIDDFKAKLSEFVRHTTMHATSAKGAPRLVLCSPIAHEDLQSRVLPDGSANNERLALYTQAMAEVAQEHHIRFVDLYQPMREAYTQSNTPLTINGVHLNEPGNRKVAEIIDRTLFGPAANHAGDKLLKLRAAIQDKNFYWFHRYRTTDGYSIFGGRRTAGGSDSTPTNEPVMLREMEILDGLTANRMPRIWARAAGKDQQVDDAGLPPPIAVNTNKPGPLADGSHPFLTGKDSLERMTVAPGMKVNLFASEEKFPELQNPVQMAVDPDGRLWVAVWPSYPHWHPSEPMNDKLLILEDTDHDGEADRCQVFADGLHNPTGFEFSQGGVFVAQVPDVLFLRDTNGDLKADVRTRVLGGIDSADTHHSINSFVLGPGGDLYFQEGIFHRTQVETPHGPAVRCIDGGLYRYEPRTHKFRVQSSFAFPNPHGHVFTYWGQDIVHDGTGARPIWGSSFAGQIDYPAKHPTPPAIYQQRTRPCSATAILSSRHFPEANRDTLLVANVIGFQGILQYRLEPDGAGMRGIEIDPLLASSDPNFRPSDLEVGADGAVFVADWQNPLIGHLQHNLRDSNRDHRHGRVYRVTAQDRPLLPPRQLSRFSLPQLLTLLEDRDNAVRYRVKLELSGRATEQVMSALRTWEKQLDPHAVDYEHHLLEALWIHQMHDVVNVELLQRVLQSQQPEARAAAVRVLRAWRERVLEAPSLLRGLAQDVHPLVRLEAVVACSDFTSAEGAEIALEITRHPRDRFLDYALQQTMHQLARYWKPALTAAMPLAADNPSGVDYLLDLVGPAELLQLPRTPTVWNAIYQRPGIPQDVKRQALLHLAQQQGCSPLSLLLSTLLSPPATTETSTLVPLLAQWDVAELRPIASELAASISDQAPALARQACLAALIRIHNEFMPVWAEYGVRYRFDLLHAITLVPESALRDQCLPIVTELLAHPPTSNRSDALTGIRYTYYEPQNLQDVSLAYLSQLTPLRVGQLANLTLDVPNSRRESIALKMQGVLQIPTAGEYTFYLRSDDGSCLYWGEELLIDNNGPHGVVEKSAVRTIPVGSHPVTLTYFNGSNPGILSLEWSGPGLSRQPIAAHAWGATESMERSAALAALRQVSSHAPERFGLLVTAARDQGLRPQAIAGIQEISVDARDKEQAQLLLTDLTQNLSTLSIAERTTPQALVELSLAKDLAQQLESPLMESLNALTVQRLELNTLPHRMAFDQSEMVVEAGRPVQLLLNNQDDMPHNFVVVRPGGLALLGELADKLALHAVPNPTYLPESDQMVVASNLLAARASERLTWMAPQEPGIYPFTCTYPGHWRRMYGAMYVVRDREGYLANPQEYSQKHNLTVRDPLLGYNRPLTSWKVSDFTDSIAAKPSSLDRSRGRALFTAANCVACHRFQGDGRELAPNLAETPPAKTALDLLHDILEPSHRINEKYQLHNLVVEGQVISGIIVAEDDTTISIVSDPLVSPEPRVLQKQAVEERTRSTTSMMPSGLLDRFSAEEVHTLIHYLLAK